MCSMPVKPTHFLSSTFEIITRHSQSNSQKIQTPLVIMAKQMIECIHDLRYKVWVLHHDISVSSIMHTKHGGTDKLILVDSGFSVLMDESANRKHVIITDGKVELKTIPLSPSLKHLRKWFKAFHSCILMGLLARNEWDEFEETAPPFEDYETGRGEVTRERLLKSFEHIPDDAESTNLYGPSRECDNLD
ncbi:hypothetical protein BDY19DRAFT_996481 [Irpex rosettiformis]|uniref:Uncharacterized protein n=1 Tax=Irpex rosettiformis TaxID=378272 RepID=A0ACB8TUW9_9APHY|nr:hypothetical protein BDY19DRAFT_996481 [Irpex rosettiformis]